VQITTVKELIKPLGRPGYAFDFPLDTGKLNPDELKGFIGREVYIQTSDGQFDFIDKTYEGRVQVEDVSDTNMYVLAQNKSTRRRERVSVDIESITLIEWSEKIVKRISVTTGAIVR
jgi:hypothetical protein